MVNCEENKIKRPDKPNVLKYISEEELAQFEDKLPEHIKNQGLYDYAINKNGTVDLIVSFHDDVTLDNAKKIIKKYGIVLDDYFYFHRLTVRIPQEGFWSLVREKEVKMVGEKEPPIVPLDSEARRG